ncbi:Dihydropyrimidinase-related protein 5 [Schistosoma japonicum]|nr:Dihydropyrimidinase-related protein 5 [Schistosoma japonicum]
MSHRREAGAVPPWVIPEEHANSTLKNKTIPIINNNLININKNDKEQVNETTINKHNQIDNFCMPINVQMKKEQLYITGGQLVNSDCMQFADILIEDGKVVSTGKNIKVQSDTPTLDASGMLIMPGGIDISTYLIQDLNSFDKEAYTNTTKKALLGGTTTIVDTILCPKGSSAVNLMKKYQDNLHETKLWCDVVIRIGFMEIQEAQLNEIDQLSKQYGINSFLFIIDPFEMNKTSEESLYIRNLLKAFDLCKQTGAIAVIKCDLSGSTDHLNKQNELEKSLVEKCIHLADSTNCPIIFTSVSEMNTIERISEGRRQIPPVHVTACCTPKTLLPQVACNQQTDNTLLHLLTNGDITLISSDQSNTNTTGKSNDLQTIGQRLITTWEAAVPSGWLDASSFVSLTSANAAQYLGLYPNKGSLYPGADADLICWPYESLTNPAIGQPTLIVHHGKVMAYNGSLIEKQGNNDALKMISLNNFNEIQPSQPCGALKTGRLFPSTIYGLVNASERLRKSNQMAIIREPWTMNNLTTELNTLQTKISNNTENSSINEQMKIDNTQIESNDSVMTSSTNTRTIRGQRDLHASGFSLSGAQIDDDRPIRSGIRTQQQNETRNPLW